LGDRLIAGIEAVGADAERIPTSVNSTTEMASWLRLSRTHLARKLREAEALGSIGWFGQRGHSVMWVSNSFRHEYATAQAVKLAIIDNAYEAAFSPPMKVGLTFQSISVSPSSGISRRVAGIFRAFAARRRSARVVVA